MENRSWHDIISPLKQTDSFRHAYMYQDERRKAGDIIYPRREDIFNAFKYTSFDNLKVVILGQDPYHEPGQAMGLSFSVPVGIPIPPSLGNIYTELKDDIPGFIIPEHGNLIPWARQGVLLLNSVLTVEAHQAFSHKNQGWEVFTDGVIKAINDSTENVVFLLWGSPARQKGAGIDRHKHLVLETVHPSPLSAYRGFFGCHHFSMANKYLKEHGKAPINWQLPVHLEEDEAL